jgi:hypothetical protein
MTTAVHLDTESVKAIAHRVAEILRGEDVAAELVDAAEIARRCNLSRDYVYSNAERLGAVKLGDGPRARLRFDPATVAERLSAQPDSAPTPAPTRRPRRRQSRGDLLPVRGRAS